jgi:esterase
MRSRYSRFSIFIITSISMNDNLLFHTDQGEGAALIILHGLFGSSDNWASLVKYWQKDFRILNADQRNHGKSPHSSPFTYQAMAEDVLHLIEHHKLEKVSILGHSMGGKTAMFFTHLYPEVVEKLIVVDIGPKHYPIHHQEIIDSLRNLNPEQFSTRGEAEKAFEGLSNLDAPTRQFLLKNLYWNEDKKLAWRMNLEGIAAAIGCVGEALPEDAQIEQPTLFIRGELSNYIKDEDLPSIREQFPDMELKTAPGAGHWVHAQAPELTYQWVKEFLV